MYNRYIPQPDGTYRRNRMQEAIPTQERQTYSPPPPPEPKQEPAPIPCSHCVRSPSPRRPAPPRPPRRPEQNSVTGFLKQLLPRDFEAEDLIVVLLLLLMSGDCQENQNTALLTLVLYLFL